MSWRGIRVIVQGGLSVVKQWGYLPFILIWNPFIGNNGVFFG
jgi:hypothetical protein